MTLKHLSIEELLLAASVEPAYSSHLRPGASTYREVAHWMIVRWPEAWQGCPPSLLDMTAYMWLELQARLLAGEIDS